MNKTPIVHILIIGLFLSCSTSDKQEDPKTNSEILEQLYLKDVEIRELDARTDTVNLENYDKIHRKKVFLLLASNAVITPLDKIRAAWILQHTAAKICDGELTSISPENFLLAYTLSSEALNQLTEKGDTVSIRKNNVPRIIALNYDRYLLFTVGHQKYGTQFVFDDATGEMVLAPIDTTLSDDTERKKYQVETLSQLLSKYKMKPMPKE